jgi:hypothetical protein
MIWAGQGHPPFEARASTPVDALALEGVDSSLFVCLCVRFVLFLTQGLVPCLMPKPPVPRDLWLFTVTSITGTANLNVRNVTRLA